MCSFNLSTELSSGLLRAVLTSSVTAARRYNLRWSADALAGKDAMRRSCALLRAASKDSLDRLESGTRGTPVVMWRYTVSRVSAYDFGVCDVPMPGDRRLAISFDISSRVMSRIVAGKAYLSDGRGRFGGRRYTYISNNSRQLDLQMS